MPQTNPKRTLYAINNDAGAFTTIRLSTFAIYVEVIEDQSQNGGQQQGLQYYALDPFAQSANILANAEGPFVAPAGGPGGAQADGTPVIPQIKFGDQHQIHSVSAQPLGAPGSAGNVDVPGGVITLGTPLLAVRTNSGNATNVLVTEYV